METNQNLKLTPSQPAWIWNDDFSRKVGSFFILVVILTKFVRLTSANVVSLKQRNPKIIKLKDFKWNKILHLGMKTKTNTKKILASTCQQWSRYYLQIILLLLIQILFLFGLIKFVGEYFFFEKFTYLDFRTSLVVMILKVVKQRLMMIRTKRI